MTAKPGISHAEDTNLFPSPEHPLPEGIARLENSDTECQYCGVSYLILHEIKQLKTELLDARNEISDLKAYRTMYDELLLKWQNHVDSSEASQSLLQEKQNLISSLQEQISSLKEENVKVTTLSHNLEMSKKRFTMLSNSYVDVFPQIRSFKNTLNGLKSMVVNYELTSKAAFQNMSEHVELEMRKACGAIEKRCENDLILQKRELLDNIHGREAEWLAMEVKLREDNASCSRELTSVKNELMNTSEQLALKSNEIIRLEHQMHNLSGQLENFKNSIANLEHSLATERANYGEMRNIIDQRSEDNKNLDDCMRRQKMELDSCRQTLENLQFEHSKEVEVLRDHFKREMKEKENTFHKQMESAVLEQKKRAESNAETAKQSIRRESDARLSAIQENFSAERNRFEAKLSQLMDTLNDYKQNNESLTKDKELVDSKNTELESKVKRLEVLLRQLHEEKLSESSKAVATEKEVVVLQRIVESQCEERSKITESMNAIKREIIKSQIPQELHDDLMQKFPDLSSSTSFGAVNDESGQQSFPRLRAWSIDNNGGVNGDYRNGVSSKQMGQRATSNPSSSYNKNENGSRQIKKQGDPALPTGKSFSGSKDKTKPNNSRFTLPALYQPSSVMAAANDISADECRITSSISTSSKSYGAGSPLNNHNSSTLRQSQGQNKVSPKSRRASSDAKNSDQSRLNKNANDIRLKIAAVLSRK